jgi:hypothetical protein
LPSDSLSFAYSQVCISYHAVDDMRMKLLGLLPVATGTGVFLLLNSNTNLLGPGTKTNQQEVLEQFLIAIGTSGALFTLGLFAYELFGIKRCHYLIKAGRELEFELDVQGQFRNRPASLLGFVDEPLASALIYPVSLAAWTFLALAYLFGPWRWLLSGAVLALGATATETVAFMLRHADRKALQASILLELQNNDSRTMEALREVLRASPKDVKNQLEKLCRKGEVRATECGWTLAPGRPKVSPSASPYDTR